MSASHTKVNMRSIGIHNVPQDEKMRKWYGGSMKHLVVGVALLFFGAGCASQTDTDVRPWAKRDWLPPIDRAAERVTKKPFGLKVSDRFQGYHTGTDFEIFDDEQKSEVKIFAACDGPVRQKQFVNGYGGVIIQGCNQKGEPVTVLYGHLKLESVKANTDDKLLIGDLIGILGKGFSTETDGERKHLHLGIHRGTAIDLRGYVPRESDLKNWINPADLLF